MSVDGGGSMSALPMRMEDRMAKKARYMSGWESSLVDEDSKPRLGLPQVFGSRVRARPQRVNNFLFEATNQLRNHERFLHEQDNGFFTFRLEHREGGAMAQHRGEERILLFRSDRPGAIAKIIYSSTPAPTNRPPVNAGIDEESELGLMTQAKIHVLDVKEPYRGMDLGGLLFSEAVSSLRHRYMDRKEDTRDDQHDDNEAQGRVPYASSIRCQLDAEEDVRRHNKLVNFYEQLGCQKKPKAKVQYLNNNDGETYRKIPMQMALRDASDDQHHGPRRKFLASDGSLVNRRGCFLPIKLLDISGASINVPQAGKGSSRQEWLMVDDGEGNIQFRTTHGLYLRADPDGRCSAAVVSADEDSDSDTPPEEWANFRLYRVSDALQEEFSADELESVPGHDARQKELWMLKTAHGTFLAAVPDKHDLYCSKTPAFWQADDDTFNLICTSDTPPRRQHYRKTWVKQTVKYVESQRERYLGFCLAKMSIRDALELVKSIPFHHFRVARNRADPGPSLRTLCFKSAEAARHAGYPDWVQLVALIHELGAVVNFIDMKTASESEDDYDWTITCRSRIVGCRAPDRASFGEFRILNVDERDSRYNSSQGMYSYQCGLDKVYMAWTGPEYMYHMLEHNGSLIPEEGLAMLRFFSLGDWHKHGEYQQLANDDDALCQPFVTEFDELRRETRRQCNDSVDLSDEECSKLWNEYYGSIVSKYCGDDALMW